MVWNVCHVCFRSPFHPTTHHWWPLDDLEPLTPLSASHLPTFSRTYSRTPPTQYLKVEPQETDSKVSEKHDFYQLNQVCRLGHRWSSTEQQQHGCHLQWRSQNAEKITHIKGRLLYQAMILYNYVPFQNWNFSERKEFAPEFFPLMSSSLRYGKSLTTLGELPWV